jgi:hypothetical protein
MGLFRNNDLAVEFDGMIAQWIKQKDSEHEIGLPITHNIIQMQRWKKMHPNDNLFIIFSTINYQESSGHLKKDIEDFLHKNNVPFDKIWRKKKSPPVKEEWRVTR